MPRLARVVVPAFPHHVTQRGNRRAQVFFSHADYRAYLDRLHEYSERHAVGVLAYCLMPNHVHLVLVPADAQGLHKLMRPLTMRYAQRFNRARDCSGVVWQGRFFSSVLDAGYLRNAVRYVERNPVRAHLIDRAEAYDWSSAAAHCGLRADRLLAADAWLRNCCPGSPDWSAWLATRESHEDLKTIRQHTEKGLPCGSPEFVDEIERMSGRALRPKRRGRPVNCTAVTTPPRPPSASYARE